eukprot:SAG31_NODE_18292_length_641_cov_1.029520_2_plen_128_part_01
MAEAEGTDQLLQAIMGAVCPEDADSGGASSVSFAFTLAVAPDFLSALGSSDAFTDCFLSPEEINSDPESMALASAIAAAVAAGLGVDPSDVTLQGINTDGNAEPGCSPEDGRPLQSDGGNELRFILAI